MSVVLGRGFRGGVGVVMCVAGVATIETTCLAAENSNMACTNDENLWLVV